MEKSMIIATQTQLARNDILDCRAAQSGTVRRAQGLRGVSLISMLASCVALSACSAPPDGAPEFNDGVPDYQVGNPSNGNAGNGNANNGNVNPTTPGAPNGNGTNAGNTGNAVNPSPNPEQPVNGTTPVTNGAGGSGNVGNTNTGGSANANTAGAPAFGAGGTGNTPDPNVPPVTPVTPPVVVTPPAGPDIPCPAGATFCSGFEGTAFPAGTQFFAVGPSVPAPFEFDTADPFDGNQSLAITATGSGGFFYRALAVPVPGQDFWVRLQMRVSTTFGDGSHDSVFGASSGALTADVNGEALVELSEQFEGLLLNTDDAVFRPPVTSTLTPDVWHCMEAHYNGASGDVEIFADGQARITANGYRPLTFQTFRLGYMRYNDDRTVWFDNVVVAPNRVNCD
jgi:hypothetical protein